MTITAQQVETLSTLGLQNSPVAIGFLATPPAGLEHINRADAASCGYWKTASEGRSFYTTSDDHGNCPVGAFTLGVDLSPAKGQELQALVGTMIELRYLSGDEVSTLPRRTTSFQIAAYAPLSDATFTPDVVVFRGNARQIMLLCEAARAAGVFSTGTVMGRPACSMLPQALAAESSVASVGCIGNRVYTGLGDDELYLTIPGTSTGAVIDKLATIVHANHELEKFHRERKATLG